MSSVSKAANLNFESPLERLLASISVLVEDPNSKTAHFYRNSLRRFEAWVDVFHPKIDREQKSALKFLEKLRKAAGKLRDSHVHIGLLKALKAIEAADQKKLHSAVKARRERRLKKLRRLLRDPRLEHIATILRPMDRGAGRTDSKAFHEIQGMATLALDEYRAFVGRHGRITPDNLHEYRLQCKRFRYTAELAGDTPEVNDLVETWKTVQDAIGEWHDYLTLTEVADKVLGKSAVRSKLRQIKQAKYEASCEAVKAAERKLITESVPKKKPRDAGTNMSEPFAVANG